MIPIIQQYGDTGLICDFGDQVSIEINQTVLSYCENLKEKNLPEIKYIVPSYNKLVVCYKSNSFEKIKNYILKLKNNTTELSNKTVTIPVDFTQGLDIEKICSYSKLTLTQFIKKICDRKFYIYGFGFLPGMPKFGDLDFDAPRRLDTPRKSVPQGSIGLTGRYGNIYSQKCSAGWNIIGVTDQKFFDAYSCKTYVNPGDFIQFEKIK